MRILIASIAILFAMLAPARSSQIFPYQFFKMDIPRCAADNELTGIDNLGQVVGYGCNPSIAFASSFPGYARWNEIGYPGAESSQVYTIDNSEDKGGEYTAGSTEQGFLRRKAAVYSSYPFPIFGAAPIHCSQTGGKHCKLRRSVGDLYAVGGNGATGFVLDVTTGVQSTISVPGSGFTVATGRNELGDTCGNYDGGIWLLKFGETTFSTYSYPGSQMTSALHLNWQKQIVGYYVGDDGLKHGYILTYPNSAKPYWQTIDVPAGWGASGTVVAGNNDHGEIVGYYLDAAGLPHGFLGLRVKSASN